MARNQPNGSDRGPLKRVVSERWEGTAFADVLECGHVLTRHAKNVPSKRRRCVYCKGGQPVAMSSSHLTPPTGESAVKQPKPMTQPEAAVEARKRWGAKASTSFNSAALKSDAKKPLSDKLDAHRRAREGDPERLTKREADRLSGLLLGHRCSVGHISAAGGIECFRVEGQGDSWEDAFAAADEKVARENAEGFRNLNTKGKKR